MPLKDYTAEIMAIDCRKCNQKAGQRCISTQGGIKWCKFPHKERKADAASNVVRPSRQ